MVDCWGENGPRGVGMRSGERRGSVGGGEGGRKRTYILDCGGARGGGELEEHDVDDGHP